MVGNVAQLGHRLGPVPASACSSRAANGQAVNAQGGLAHTDRHALAFLAAGANPAVELHVVADHGDALEALGAAANQGGAFDRVLDLAVFDPISLTG